MKVYIDKQVYKFLSDFYTVSMRLHSTLDYNTVIAKIDRLEKAIYEFADYASLLKRQPYRNDWKNKGWFEFVTENFHFAYQVYHLPNGEHILYIHDAVHDKLNYNLEDK